MQFKKLIKSSEQAAIIGNHYTKRLFIHDKIADREFLIDSGADYSILAPTKSMRINYNNNINDNDDESARYYAANGTIIKTFGSKLLELNLGLRRLFSWRFTIADVTTSIIGADFLFEFGLMVDVRGKQLVDRETGLSSKGTLRSLIVPQVSLFDSKHKFAFLFSEFKELLDDKPSFKVKEKVQVTHFIETTGRPVTARVRQLPPDKLMAAKAEFNELLRLGICRPSKSNYASPLHLVRKANGDWRPCGDYKRLNASTTPDLYPVPLLRDFQSILHRRNFFSRIDLRKAYHQIPMEQKDIPKTAIITPFGLYEFLFMPFGLRNAAQTFQRLIDETLRGLDFVFAFIDDIGIASTTYDEHLEHIRIVFTRLRDCGLRINSEKCEFAVKEMKFLGHIVSADGVKPTPEKVEAIAKCKKPTLAHELRRFLSMINFYRRFIPNAAEVQSRLQTLIIGNKKNDKTKLIWTPDASAAFEQYKTMLTNETLLVNPAHNAKIIVATDASATCMGGVVHQFENGNIQPLGFFSKKLDEREQKYPTYDRELLAIYRTIQHFEYILEGRQFVVYCDHKPLSYAFTKKPHNELSRRLEQLHYISQFTNQIVHVAGRENIVADILSRIEAIQSHVIDYQRMAAAQKTDEELKELMSTGKSSLVFKSIKIPESDSELICDVSGKNLRPYVPNNFRNIIIDKLHSLSHPGVRATTKLVQNRFVWPNLRKYCKNFVIHCIACQKAKVQRHSKAPLTPYESHCNRFEHINIDLVGPLPESNGFNYLLTIIDRNTRWPEAIPISNITAETVSKALISGWIARYGVPNRISTDRGRQFESQLFNQLNEMLGIKHLRTTSFHAQANGLIERWHRSLKASLKAKFTNDWSDELPLILLGLRAAIKEDIGFSPAELVFGKQLLLPGQFFNEPNKTSMDVEFITKLKQTMNDIRPRQPVYHDKPRFFVHPDLINAKHVFIRTDAHKTPLQAPYKGPFRVLRNGEKFFKIEINGKPDTVSIDRLKPAYLVHQSTDSTITSNHLTNNQPSIVPSSINGQKNQTNNEFTSNNKPREENRSNVPQQPHTITRSGRHVKFPDRLKF